MSRSCLARPRAGGRPGRISRGFERDPISGPFGRVLPKDFPPWPTVYWWFRRFVRRFLFQTIHDVALMLDSERVGREASPTGGVIDSQTSQRRLHKNFPRQCVRGPRPKVWADDPGRPLPR